MSDIGFGICAVLLMIFEPTKVEFFFQEKEISGMNILNLVNSLSKHRYSGVYQPANIYSVESSHKLLIATSK